MELFENYGEQDTNGDGISDYNEMLKYIAINEVKKMIKEKSYYQDDGITLKIGTFLGQYYYTGNTDTSATGDSPVEIKVDKLQEYVNNELVFNTLTEYSSDFERNTSLPTPIMGRIITNFTNLDPDDNGITPTEIAPIKAKITTPMPLPTTEKDLKDIDINTVVENRDSTGFLVKDSTKDYYLFLTKVLTPEATAEDMNYESYLAEIMGYSIATGRRDMNSIPGNLLYRHSENTDIDLDDGLNEPDETWAETINIHQPFR